MAADSTSGSPPLSNFRPPRSFRSAHYWLFLFALYRIKRALFGCLSARFLASFLPAIGVFAFEESAYLRSVFVAVQHRGQTASELFVHRTSRLVLPVYLSIGRSGAAASEQAALVQQEARVAARKARVSSCHLFQRQRLHLFSVSRPDEPVPTRSLPAASVKRQRSEARSFSNSNNNNNPRAHSTGCHWRACKDELCR